jgi:hypothetical protein
MTRITVIVSFALGLSLALHAQDNPAHRFQRLDHDKATADILDHAAVVAGNLQTGILALVAGNENFKPAKQQPEERAELPDTVVYKDGSFEFDWTPGQAARYYMEVLRQEIHELQGAEKGGGFAAFLPAGRESWQKLRDLACREYPGIRYFDLDGIENYCPDVKRESSAKR